MHWIVILRICVHEVSMQDMDGKLHPIGYFEIWLDIHALDIGLWHVQVLNQCHGALNFNLETCLQEVGMEK